MSHEAERATEEVLDELQGKSGADIIEALGLSEDDMHAAFRLAYRVARETDNGRPNAAILFVLGVGIGQRLGSKIIEIKAKVNR
jgi:hypothetical protein